MRIKLLVACLCLGLSLTACELESIPRGSERSPDPTRDAVADIELDQNDSRAPHSDLADMIEEVLPTVVNVRIEAIQFDDFGEPQVGRGQGSGVVIDESGVIVTNNHVVAGATEVEVIFTDERGTMTGTVLGTAPEKDLAVIKVDADDLTPIELGRSSSLRLGDDVVALGFPLGLGGTTVTKGIVSAVDRTIEVGGSSNGVSRLEGLLQTDAAINPGNSGGALVDVSGNLIGINTAAAQAASAENIGFAIPIDIVTTVVGEILDEPAEDRAWLGVQIQSVNSAAVANQLGLPSSVRGAFIVGLFPDGPAAAGGVEAGDVIIEVAGEGLASAEDLTEALTAHDPDETIPIVVLREGEEITLDVKLGSRPVTIE
ncbi:MAG: S1C family serine protease [Actinomycetota bacterium]